MLSDLGFEVLQSKDGLEADNILKKRKVDVVISEYNLPKIDGITLLRKIRLDSKMSNMPFIMLSATIEQSEVARAIRLGVSEYLVKPFSVDMLYQRLIKAIENPIKVTFALKKPRQSQTNLKVQAEKKHSILIVDDVTDNIKIISDSLRSFYKMRAVTTGANAIKVCLSDSPPDLILLDIMMPDMDGLEVCKWLKKSPVTQHIPIIFITALTQAENVVEGLKVGAVDYITKPINPHILKARVDTQCKILAINDNLREQVDMMVENVQLRDECDRIVQHDLRIPLSELTETIKSVENHYRNPVKVLQSVKSLRQSSGLLAQQIDNIITLYKLEDGSYKYQPVSLILSDIVNDVRETFSLSSSKKLLEINSEIDLDICIEGEVFLTKSLISNIYKNAMEAAPRGSAITFASKTAAGKVILTIQNYGMVADKIADQLFEKYTSHGKRNAVGVGAYLSKLMIEMQGGTISFESNQQQSTTTLKMTFINKSADSTT